MADAPLLRFAGWSAYIAAIATVVGAVTLVIFFSMGEPFGTINDISSIIIAVTGIPILLALHRLHSAVSYPWSLAALVIGVAALLFAGAAQTSLVLGITRFEQSPDSSFGFGVFGVAIAVHGCLAWVRNVFPRALAVWGIVAGVGYALVSLGFILGGPDGPLTYAGGAAAVVAYPVWSIWLGRLFLRGPEGTRLRGKAQPVLSSRSA
jgi:hypothetical protein